MIMIHQKLTQGAFSLEKVIKCFRSGKRKEKKPLSFYIAYWFKSIIVRLWEIIYNKGKGECYEEAFI